MTRFTNPLDGVRVASPCTADWGRMRGDERVRFCAQCELSVYNLSEMTREEAEALITNAEGRLCVRYYRRADGTILTRNCPVGLQAFKRRVTGVARRAASAVLGFAAGLGVFSGMGRIQDTHEGQMMMGAYPAREAMLPRPEQKTVGPSEVVMGDIAVEPREVWANGRAVIHVQQVKVRPGDKARR